jgi:hypothetical protein
MTENRFRVRILPDARIQKKRKKDVFLEIVVTLTGTQNCMNDFHQVFTETQYNEHEGAVVSNTEERER